MNAAFHMLGLHCKLIYQCPNIYYLQSLAHQAQPSYHNANSLDLDEMPSNSASHPDPSCLTLGQGFYQGLKECVRSEAVEDNLGSEGVNSKKNMEFWAGSCHHDLPENRIKLEINFIFRIRQASVLPGVLIIHFSSLPIITYILLIDHWKAYNKIPALCI